MIFFKFTSKYNRSITYKSQSILKVTACKAENRRVNELHIYEKKLQSMTSKVKRYMMDIVNLDKDMSRGFEPLDFYLSNWTDGWEEKANHIGAPNDNLSLNHSSQNL